MRRLTLLALVLIASSGLLSPPLFYAASANPSSYPPYAEVGGYAFYSGDGGFIPYMSGVSANISYYVTDVFQNNTMKLLVNANLSMGSEVSTTPAVVSENLTDQIYSPKFMPAIPPQNLTANSIVFQNITCTLIGNSKLQVPAGKFNATEFQGRDANGSVLSFWFDRSTGIALQMVEAASYFQLVQTNIATPLSTQQPIQAEAPFIIIFAVGWGAAGLLFYGVVRYYSKKGSRDASIGKMKN
jgi:hypothetical protein